MTLNSTFVVFRKKSKGDASSYFCKTLKLCPLNLGPVKVFLFSPRSCSLVMMSFPFQFLVASETSSCYFGHCVPLWVSQSAGFPQNLHQTVFLRRTAWISHSLICNLIPSSYCSYQLAINQSQNKPIRRCLILANS